ncbi:hypothetical protein [Butyrivibrio sp. YAB3001]|uniref:hypothetical protein n=1 Tax=Butyrivibrio sp. YAB3001 TaxID=1520812 RepID=UPI0008F66C69|nr:hypothetical protein [Butyrivibrio sp. YAB3001]SFB72551.1 hypothetical protein SAMN02910398_00456 [Butyrivibrio sp. YAB3001]
MKKKVLLAFKTAVFLLLLFGCLYMVSLIVERKSSYDKNELFFKEAKNDHIDAFILGSSHVINGINPIQLYEDYGITAYNLGGYGSVLLSSYWQMMMALDYCTPKVVIVDAYMLENDIRYVDDPNANVNSDELHLNIDRFPLNRTKLNAIDDMFFAQDKKYAFWADFIVYHDRWKELNSNDFKRITGDAEINRLMGAVMNYEIHSAEYTYNDYQTGTLPNETVGTTYLKKIIEECQSRGINVVVTTVPFLAMEADQQASHTAKQIAEEYGVASVNMLDIPGIIDINSDMADPGHLNILGASKVTAFLGAYLNNNYELPDHRGDAKYQLWQDCVNEYYSGLDRSVNYNEDIYTQLMMLRLSASDKTYAISIRGASSVYADPTLIRQLKSLGAGSEFDRGAFDKCSYMLVVTGGQAYEYAGDGEEKSIETKDGVLTYIPVSDIYRVLNINGDADNNYLYSDSQAYADVQVLLIEDGEVKSHQYYTSDHFTYEHFMN